MCINENVSFYKNKLSFHVNFVNILKDLKVLQCSWMCEWFTCLKNVLGYYCDIYIFVVSYFIYNLFDRTVGCA